MRRFLTVVAGVTCVIALAVPSPARAQAPLLGSTPAPGETVGSGTSAIALTFAEVAAGDARITVTGPYTVLTGRPVVVEAKTICALVQPLTDGAYTIDYRATSRGGAPVSGKLSFTVAAGGRFIGLPKPCDRVDLPTPFPVSGGYAAVQARAVSPVAVAGGLGTVAMVVAALWFGFRRRRANR